MRQTLERKQRETVFTVSAGGAIDRNITVSPGTADLLTFAGVYGAIGGTLIRDRDRTKSGGDGRPSPEQIQQFKEIATRIVSSAPAFVCRGRLQSDAASFADAVAFAMLL